MPAGLRWQVNFRWNAGFAPVRRSAFGESGRWFTRSLYKDKMHFLSHEGAGMAVTAIAGYEEA